MISGILFIIRYYSRELVGGRGMIWLIMLPMVAKTTLVPKVEVEVGTPATKFWRASVVWVAKCGQLASTSLHRPKQGIPVAASISLLRTRPPAQLATSTTNFLDAIRGLFFDNQRPTNPAASTR